MLAAAAMAALALSACGGGGGGGGSGGPVVSGGGGLAPSLTAGGVTARVSWAGGPVLTISKGGTEWIGAVDDADTQAPPSGWNSVTRTDNGENPTARFRLVAKINSANDEDYLAYGYWNRVPLDGLDDFKPFYYGHTPYTGNVRQQTGTATYTGGATGVYQLNPAPGSTAANGRFTGDVTINVSFGSNTEAASLQFGMSNIATRNSAGTAAGPSVSDTGSRALIAEATGSSFTGTGSTTGSRWGGRFFGPGSGKPTGIAGWFEKLRATDSSSNSVILYGVFGAKR